EAYQELGRLWREEGRAVIVVTHDVRLASLLGPAEQVRVIGVKGGKLLPEIELSDPHLGAVLSDLYGVHFIERRLPGGLSVDLSRFPPSWLRSDTEELS